MGIAGLEVEVEGKGLKGRGCTSKNPNITIISSIVHSAGKLFNA